MKRLLTTIALCAPLFAASNDSFLLRNVTIHPVSGPDIENGSILVENGKIVDVGAKVTATRNARVIDAKGLHAYPGMIDSATEIGLSEVGSVRETNDTGELGEFNPQLHALIAVNPDSEHIPVTRANGITSVITLPGSGGRGGGGRGAPAGVITGQATLIHLDGWTWEEMDLRRTAAMQLVFPSIAAGGRGGEGGGFFPRTSYAEQKRTYEAHLAELAQFMESARRYQKAKAAHEPGFRPDLKFEAMIPVLEGKVPMFVNATREKTIRDAIQFADKEHVRIVLAGVREPGKTLLSSTLGS